MKKIPLILVLCLCGAGLFVGVAARRLAMRPPPVTAARVVERSQTSSPKVIVATAPPISKSHSADTLETLATLPITELYSRLAAWLVDANEQDIAAYWASYRTRKRTNGLTGLVFLNWTRLNPQAAIAATAGTKDEDFAWWAWACHDPRGALAAALANGPERVEAVARGLGEFHPAWLRQHFNEIPEAAREHAFSGMEIWGDAETPLEMLNFAKEHGITGDSSTFKALVSKDPWAALNWVKDNPYDLGQFVSQMAEERPDDLARVVEQAPSGYLKRRMEAALFANLIETDPTAAIAQAKATAAPRIAAERLTIMGLALVKIDPGQAFELADYLLAACPDAMTPDDSIQLPGESGGAGSLDRGEKVTEFMDSLWIQDTARLMDIVTAHLIGNPRANYSFQRYGDTWARRDVAAYGEWIKRQSDPVIRNDATNQVVSRLHMDGQYRDAADWALTMAGPNRIGTVMNLTTNWAQKDRSKALEWLESAELPAKDKSTLRNNIAQ